MKFKLDHISYAVSSTDTAIKKFSLFFPEVKVYRCYEKNQNVYITYLANSNSDYYLELVEPAEGENPVNGMLESKQSAIYHLAYRVENFDEAVKILKDDKYLMITNPFEMATEEELWASHFYSPELGIVEIIGRRKNA